MFGNNALHNGQAYTGVAGGWLDDGGCRVLIDGAEVIGFAAGAGEGAYAAAEGKYFYEGWFHAWCICENIFI